MLTSTLHLTHKARRMARDSQAVHRTIAHVLDRRWLRVHPLCSYHEESGVHGRDMASWEDDYYADAIHAAIQKRRANGYTYPDKETT